MRRAALGAQRRLQPGLHQPGQVRPAGRPKAPIAWDALEQTVRLGVRFLDDVIEVNPYPLAEIMEEVQRQPPHRPRRHGLGGSLDPARHPYDSQAALDLGGQGHGVHHRSAATSRRAGRGARTRSPTGPAASTGGTAGPQLHGHDHRAHRHASASSPDCSSGIEPLFAVAYSHIVGDRHLTFVNPHFEAVAKAARLLQRRADGEGRRSTARSMVSPRSRRTSDASSSRRTRSRSSGMSACRPPSRSTRTTASRRRSIFRTTRPWTMWREPTTWPTTSGASGSRSFVTDRKSGHGGQVLHVGTGSTAAPGAEKGHLEEHEGLAHVPTTVSKTPTRFGGSTGIPLRK